MCVNYSVVQEVVPNLCDQMPKEVFLEVVLYGVITTFMRIKSHSVLKG